MIGKFRKIGKNLVEMGLCGLYSGSMSVKVDDKMIITKSGIIFSDMNDDDLIEIDLKNIGSEKAPADVSLHRAIYESSLAKAIIIANPINAIALSLNEEKIIPQDHFGKTILKSIPVIRVRDAQSAEEIIKYLIPALKAGYVSAMIRGFGSVVTSQSLEDALKFTSTLERSCQIIFASRHTLPQPMQRKDEKRSQYRSAIPPSIGVMDRSYHHNRGKR